MNRFDCVCVWGFELFVVFVACELGVSKRVECDPGFEQFESEAYWVCFVVELPWGFERGWGVKVLP